MSATLPLVLELTPLTSLISSPDEAVKEGFDVANTRYNPETQLRENSAGEPQIYNGLSITLSVVVSTVLAFADCDNAQDDNEQ
jgi:hypothetical protein